MASARIAFGAFPGQAGSRRSRVGGFTLVEVLVALFILAIVAGLSWRGIDGMLRTRDASQERLERQLRLQSVIGQWEADLNALQDTDVVPALQFDGASLRLTEGMAEWASFAVLERLALDTLADRRAIAYGEIRDYPALYPGRLDLATLGTPRGYTARLRRDGSQATYQLAFLMSDHLVQRHGFDQLLVYYRGFAAGRSRFENFYISFGQSLPDFETAMVSRFGHGPR